MKTLFLVFAALPALAQQPFDFSSLDKLSPAARESTNITLEGEALKLAQLAGNFAGGDELESLKTLIANLKGVYVRTFEFEKEGQYGQSDLAPFRAHLQGLRWSKIVDVKEKKESSEIYVQPLPNDRIGGLAVIAAEPKELTIVYIVGSISIKDLNRLSGHMGIPDMKLLHNDGKEKN